MHLVVHQHTTCVSSPNQQGSPSQQGDPKQQGGPSQQGDPKQQGGSTSDLKQQGDPKQQGHTSDPKQQGNIVPKPQGTTSDPKQKGKNNNADVNRSNNAEVSMHSQNINYFYIILYLIYRKNLNTCFPIVMGKNLNNKM